MARFFTFLVVCVCMCVSLHSGRAQDKKEAEPKEFGKTISEWIELLRKGDDPKHRRAALIALEYSAKAQNVGLSAVLDATRQEKEKDVEVRQHAVLLVGRLGPDWPGTTKALFEVLLHDKTDAVREAAATSLGGTKFIPMKFAGFAPEYLNVLIDKLKDPHAGTRVAIVSTLRNMDRHAERAVPALIDSAKDPKEHALVRAGAIHIISRHGKDDAKTLPALIDIVNQTDGPVPVREVAMEGLGRLGGESSDAVNALAKALVEKNTDVRKASAAALLVLGVKAQAAWPAAKTRFTGESDNSIRNHVIRLAGLLGKTNDEAVTLLTVAAEKDDSNENRLAAIQELGELAGRAKSSIEALDRIRKNDGRASIREAAEKALLQIKTAK